MPDHSHSDSSPKYSSSAGSSSSVEEVKPIPAEGSHSYGNAQHSSNDSGSSDGVLVELPGHPDQASRGLRWRADSGILVNIDGSTQEPMDDSEREEMFEDASDLARIPARFDDAIAECQKYKEEREVFGKDVVSQWQKFQDIFDRYPLLTADNDRSVRLPQLETSGCEDGASSSPTPLHSTLSDCSKSLVRLKAILDERINSESTIRDLHAALSAKDQEIKRLLAPLVSAEDSSSDDTSLVEKKTMSLIEKHNQFLSEVHQLRQCLAEVKPAFASLEDNDLDNVFSLARAELLESKRQDVYLQERMDILEEENGKLVEQLKRMRERLETANRETNNTRAELKQAENKLVAAKEKLSIAVTKGKTLVQHRDSLKLSLEEKTSELEKCIQESQQKSEALQATEASLEELKWLFSKKTSELENCLEELQQKTYDLEAAKANVEDLNATHILVSSLQELLSQRDNYLWKLEEAIVQVAVPEELLSMEVIDRIRWLINQKNDADITILDNRKIQDVMSSIELPEDVSPRELVCQIKWLASAFTHAKDDIAVLQDEINGTWLALGSHESEMSEKHKKIDHLESSLLEEKLAKGTLHNEHEDLKCRYQKAVEELSRLSSDKDRLMKVLLELSESTLDDQFSLDISAIIENCMIKIRERMKSSLTQIEQFERMQSTLYLTHQELKLYEKIFEDEMIDRSAMMRLSDELAKWSNEAIILKIEKDSIQKELEQAEEKSSQLKEKLSMLMKKEKGLVQEHEGFKISLDEKISEIEKLKHELQLKFSTINEYQEQIKSLSDKAEHSEKLEEDIVSLKDEIDQSQQNLNESNTILKNLVTSIEKIILPTVYVLKEPLEKVNWIAKHLQQSEVEKIHALQELDKVKEEASLQGIKLDDAFATIKALEDELSKAEKHISLISEEKSLIQLGMLSIEQELKKLHEKSSLQASKLSEAYATIQLLKDSILEEEKNIAQLNADRNKLEAENKKQKIELNAKLAECSEELARARGSLESYSAELNGQLEHFQIFLKDESLFSTMTEQFSIKIEGLRKINNIIQNMHNQFSSKGLSVHPSMKHDPAVGKLSSLPKFEGFLNNRAIQFKASAADNEDVSSLARIMTGLHARAEHLNKNFVVFCNVLDEHIAATLLALQDTGDEFVRVLEYSESLKLDVHKLEAHNEGQDAKFVSLQKEMMRLFSSCVDATQELTEVLDSRDDASILEQEAFSGGLEEDTGRYVKAADSLLLAAKRIKNQYQQLSNEENALLTSTDDMKNKLKQAELIAETAIQDQMFSKGRVLSLERDLETLKESCSKMKIKLENYQAKECMLRNKEELSSMKLALDRVISGQELSKSQMDTLMDKVKKLEIPFYERGTRAREVHFSSPVEKLLFIVDKVIDMKKRKDIMASEKEDMQSVLESQASEVEYLKKVAETLNTNYHDLELKKNELLETSGGLERIIKKLGGNVPLQDQKPLGAKLLLAMLERLTTALSLESENLRSRAEKLGAQLQTKDRLIDELSDKVKMFEDSIHAQSAQQELEITKEKTIFEATPAAIGLEKSEIEYEPTGKNTISTVSTAAQLRTMRKGSNDYLVINIDSEYEHLIDAQETDVKGHVFKSLNTSGLIPKEGKLIADRIDRIWVSGGQLLMGRPRARLGLIAYLFILHLWLLGTIL